MPEIKAKEIKMVDPALLVDHPRNNNKHSDEQIDRLCKLISHTGFRDPLTVSNQSGFLIAGHARKLAALKLGLKKVPVCYQDFKNEAEEYQYLTADNEIARWAELDKVSLLDNIKDLGLKNTDLDLFGLPELKIDVSEIDMPELPDGDKSELEQITFTLHESQMAEVRNAMALVKEKYNEAVNSSLNENSNGNAIAYICELFVSNER